MGAGLEKPAWQYDELKHAGVDYADPAQAAVYDKRHQRFRDYRKDAEAVAARLGVNSEHTIVDLGAGTGAFTLHAAPMCRKIFAVDVSRPMLEFCRKEAARRKLTNIVFHQGGFLTYRHAGERVDFIVSSAALHHLPDFWKAIGLRRMKGMLKPGGRLYLFDIVFPDEGEALSGPISLWRDSLKEKAGAEFAAEVDTHIRDEHSTYDWIMEGLLTRAGFRIDQAEYGGGFGATYLCTYPG
jgi:putative AdoMet-dependent methyltransferase